MDDIFVRFLLIVPIGFLFCAPALLLGTPVSIVVAVAWVLFATIGLDVIRDLRR